MRRYRWQGHTGRSLICAPPEQRRVATPGLPHRHEVAPLDQHPPGLGQSVAVPAKPVRQRIGTPKHGMRSLMGAQEGQQLERVRILDLKVLDIETEQSGLADDVAALPRHVPHVADNLLHLTILHQLPALCIVLSGDLQKLLACTTGLMDVARDRADSHEQRNIAPIVLAHAA
jgi:hypothetical protein